MKEKRFLTYLIFVILICFCDSTTGQINFEKIKGYVQDKKGNFTKKCKCYYPVHKKRTFSEKMEDGAWAAFTWTGECKNGFITGKGTFESKNPHSRKEYKYERYIGEYEKGYRKGRGVYSMYRSSNLSYKGVKEYYKLDGYFDDRVGAIKAVCYDSQGNAMDYREWRNGKIQSNDLRDKLPRINHFWKSNNFGGEKRKQGDYKAKNKKEAFKIFDNMLNALIKEYGEDFLKKTVMGLAYRVNNVDANGMQPSQMQQSLDERNFIFRFYPKGEKLSHYQWPAISFPMYTNCLYNDTGEEEAQEDYVIDDQGFGFQTKKTVKVNFYCENVSRNEFNDAVLNKVEKLGTLDFGDFSLPLLHIQNEVNGVAYRHGVFSNDVVCVVLRGIDKNGMTWGEAIETFGAVSALVDESRSNESYRSSSSSSSKSETAKECVIEIDMIDVIERNKDFKITSKPKGVEVSGWSGRDRVKVYRPMMTGGSVTGEYTFTYQYNGNLISGSFTLSGTSNRADLKIYRNGEIKLVEL